MIIRFIPDPSRRPAAALALAALLAGCGEKITVYEAPKDVVQQAPDPHAAMARPAVPKVAWDALPEGWEATAAGDMRAATFAINDAAGAKAAELAVLPFPGASALNDLNIVNMWREQLGMEKLSDAEIEKQRKTVKVGDTDGALYDISGGENQIVSVIASRQGWMWFFKLAGKSAVVEANKPRLVEFLKDVRFVEGAAPEMSAAAAEPAAPGTPDWKKPSGWTAQAPGMMQLAKFTVAGDGGEAEISVARLGGMAGGLGPNINRWRGQLGMGSVSDAEAEALAKPIKVAQGEARLVEIAGEAQTMTVVMVNQGGSTWFYKLTGTAAAVEREKTALVEFVNSANYK